MRIEEGKFYRTRDGRKVGPIEPWTSIDIWKWQGTEPGKDYSYLWDENGVNYDGEGSPHDLVAEWVEVDAQWFLDTPARPSPIITETVTTRRLEPGVYGPLRVWCEVSVPDCERPDEPPENRVEVSLVRMDLSASDWRELARVALEIAEYLDAQ